MKTFRTPKFWPVFAQIKPLNVQQANRNLVRYGVPIPELIHMKRKFSTGLAYTKEENVIMLKENEYGEVKVYDIGWK